MTADPADPRSSTVVQLPNGRWAPGNPGRKPGSRNRISSEAMASVRSLKDEAIAQLKRKLESGSWDAVIFILERCLPRGRSIELPDTDPTTIAQMLADGTLTTIEAKDVATALAKLQDITELATIRQKLDEIEKLITDGKA